MIDRIRKQQANANQHTERGMAALDASIAADGWIGALTVAADGEAFDGSARLDIGPGFENPIVIESDGSRPIIHVRTDLPSATDPKAVRLGIAANRVAELNLSWDGDVLAALDVDLTGLWTDDELAALLTTEPTEGAGGDDFDTTPDEGPTRVQPGEMWQLGRHRLLCGESTKREDVERLMGGERAAAVITDPPYNVDFKYDGAYAGQDDKSTTEYAAWLRSALSNGEECLSDGGVVFVWQAQPNVQHFAEWFRDRDWRMFAACKNFIQSRPTWMQFAWDPVIVWTHGKNERKNHAGIRDWHLGETSNTQPTVDRVISGVHPCPRPLDTVQYVIEGHTSSGDVALDLFLGSGTTLIACERTGRRCYGIEIEPRYCDVILKRFEAESGQLAERID